MQKWVVVVTVKPKSFFRSDSQPLLNSTTKLTSEQTNPTVPSSSCECCLDNKNNAKTILSL